MKTELPSFPAGTVFEVVDATNEETYWSLGVFAELARALDCADIANPSDIPCRDHDEWGYSVRLEIRARVLGWTGRGRCVAKIEWTREDSDDEESRWTRKETLQ
jgi:hypothetical protein